MKEFLEYGIFEDLEPSDHYDKHGLWFPKSKSKKIKRKCVDLALKKLYGKDWNKPTGAKRSDFKKK
jgi:hypothetical protein